MENSRRRRGGYCMRIASRRAAVCDSGPSGTAGAGAGAGALASPGRPVHALVRAFLPGRPEKGNECSSRIGWAGWQGNQEWNITKTPCDPPIAQRGPWLSEAIPLSHSGVLHSKSAPLVP